MKGRRACGDFGQIVGVSYAGGDDSRAVVWDKGVIAELGSLAPSSFSEAAAVNDRGQITGYSDSANGFAHAVRWESDRRADADR